MIWRPARARRSVPCITTGSCSATSRLHWYFAEDSETARFSASLVRVEYEREAHVTDMYSKLDDAIAVKEPAKPRGDVEKALADSDVRHHGEYYVPIRTSTMSSSMYASTVIKP